MKTNIYLIKLNSYESVQDKEDFEAKQQKVLAICPTLEPKEYIEGDSFQALFEYTTLPADKMLIADLKLANIHFEIESKSELVLDASVMFAKVADKQIAVEETSNTYNTKCEVHMPGNALSAYNETLLLEDSCTDALQDALAKGWRIIAAMPQPNQRRPDYVLGRFNPNYNVTTDALRQAN